MCILQLCAQLRRFTLDISILQSDKRKAANRHAFRHWQSQELALGLAIG